MNNLKKNLFLICCTVFLIACSSNKTVTESDVSTIKEDVHTVLNNWHKAVADEKFNQYFNAMDNPSIFIGTDARKDMA